jgi:hypothetical protein
LWFWNKGRLGKTLGVIQVIAMDDSNFFVLFAASIGCRTTSIFVPPQQSESASNTHQNTSISDSVSRLKLARELNGCTDRVSILEPKEEATREYYKGTQSEDKSTTRLTGYK